MRGSHYHSDLLEHKIRKPKRRPSRSEQRKVTGSPVRRRKHRNRGHHGHNGVSGEKEKTPSTLYTTLAPQLEEDTGPFYFIDRKGDPQNVIYGGNYGGSVPRYRKTGYGSLIGADRQYRVSEDGSKASKNECRFDGARRSHENSLANFRDSRKGIEKVIPDRTGSDDGIRLQRSYISVDSRNSKRRKRNQAEPKLDNPLDVVMNQSKSSKGNADCESTEHSESEFSQSSTSREEDRDAYEAFRNDIHRQRLIELNRATIERPEDIDAWLALIAHQDFMFVTEERAQIENSSATAKQNLAEIKLALYEKALTRVTNPHSRDRLTAGLMDEGSIIWDTEMLLRKWKAVIMADSSTNTWIRYLNFRQTTSMTFNYEECLSVHRQCLERALLEKDPIIKDNLCVYVILRTANFMLQSGYLERATAIWQSLLDFTFFRPGNLDESTELSSFQAFWESEVPRLGEEGSVGWGLSQPTEVPTRTHPVSEITFSNDLYEKWARREIDATAFSIFPARSLDNVAEDDPYRVILFSDISEYLFRPSDNAGQFLLLNAVLKFGGLPGLHRFGSYTHGKWWSDQFLCSAVRQDQAEFIGGNTVSETSALFPYDSTFSVFSHADFEPSKARTAWIRTVLRQLVHVLNDDDVLAEYVIAFEASMDLKEARKYTKNLLKSRPSRLRLYNAYALLECRLDRFEIADHAWATAISMCQTSSSGQEGDLTLAWSSWLWELVRLGKFARAQRVLLCIPDGRYSTNPASIESIWSTAARVRVKRHLQSHLSKSISLRQEDAILYFTELFALFEYLASSQLLSSALSVYRSTLETLDTISVSTTLVEAFHQSRGRLLHLHPSVSPRGYRPAEINKYLAESRQAFPNNSFFYQLYQEHTRRSGLLDRIRDIVPTKILPIKDDDAGISVTQIIFTIQSEISRPSYAGSTNHSVRAAFEHAVATAKSCVRIWAWYVGWEADLDSNTVIVVERPKGKSKREIELRRRRLVDVYYRSVRACPWAKDLYMLAFTNARLRDAVGNVELRKIYDTMAEKGLRLHVDLETIF